MLTAGSLSVAEWIQLSNTDSDHSLTNIVDFAAEGNILTNELTLDEHSPDTPAHQVMYFQAVTKTQSVPRRGDDEARLTPSSEDFYPKIAIAALMRILKDESLSVHHSSVTQAIMYIFKSLGLRSVPFLDQMIPYLLQLFKRSGSGVCTRSSSRPATSTNWSSV